MGQPLSGGKAIHPAPLTDALHSVGTPDLGQERIQWIAAGYLPAIGTDEREPLAVMHGGGRASPAKDVDGHLPQAAPTQFPIKPLKTQLGTTISELLDFAQ